MLNNLMRNPEYRERIVSLIGMAGLLMLLASFVLTGLLDWYFVAGFIVYAAALWGICEFLQARSPHRKDKIYDERQVECKRLAGRNGYVFTLVLIGVVALATGAGYNPLASGGTGNSHYAPLLSTLMIMYGLIMAAEFVSYIYYLGRGVA